MATPPQAADAVSDGALGAIHSSPEFPTALASPPAKVEPAVIVTDKRHDQSIGASGVREGHANGNGIDIGKQNGLKVASQDETPPEGGRLHLTVLPSEETSPSLVGDDTSTSRPKPERPTSIVPLFWQSTRQASRSSIASVGNLASSTASGITLTDNTTSSPTTLSPTVSSSGLGSPLWARQVDIDEYVKIEGDVPGVGGYIVWLVKVQTLEGGARIVLRKRYSEFEALRAQLAATFPRAGEALPALPAKSVFYKFRASFLEKRRVGLAYFLK